MARRLFAWILGVFLILGMLGQALADSKRPRILYLNSASKDDHWWRTSSEIMQTACDDLGMTLDVVYVGRNQIQMVNDFKAAVKGPNRPDAVVFQSLKQNAVSMLNIAEENKIPAFIFNAGLTSEQIKLYGGPREHYKYWIGQMLPDDKQAGYDLALALYQEALKQGLTNADGKVELIGINGEVADGAAIERSAGLALAVQQEPKIVLTQNISGRWQREKGKSVFLSLNRRYPNAKVVWAANDLMGLGALDGMIEGKMNPGKGMLVGAIDWIPEALQEIKNGRMMTSFGGHFMETGWIAILLHDYFHNKDFASETVNFKSQMATLSSTDSTKYLKEFKLENFKKIDFSQFSKVKHPETKKYDFRFALVMKKLIAEAPKDR